MRWTPDCASIHREVAYFAPIRRSPRILILNVAGLRLRSKSLCGLVLEQNLPLLDEYGS
jgi:hypothetical protein